MRYAKNELMNFKYNETKSLADVEIFVNNYHERVSKDSKRQSEPAIKPFTEEDMVKQGKKL